MSMHKKRSLSGIGVDKREAIEENKSIVTPAVSMTKKENYLAAAHGEAVRATEFLVDPFDCRPWKFHNRDDVWMSPDKCSDLISSIRKNGQKVPVFARKLEADPEGKKWEIIAGRRRWFACQYLGKKIRVKATDANDRECAILMNLENKDRDDISEFEDAISYRRQLDAKLFDNQEDMAVALDLKKSKLSKMLSAAKITDYNEIMLLISDITTLKINPVYSLISLIEKNKLNKEIILKKADNLQEKKRKSKLEMTTTVIIKELIKSLQNSTKNEFAAAKYFKINEKTIIRAHQVSAKKIVFEFNKENSAELPHDELEALTLAALKEFAC